MLSFHMHYHKLLKWVITALPLLAMARATWAIPQYRDSEEASKLCDIGGGAGAVSVCASDAAHFLMLHTLCVTGAPFVGPLCNL